MNPEPVLIFGATGMLGSAIHRVLHDGGLCTVGVTRGASLLAHPWLRNLSFKDVRNLFDLGELRELFGSQKPRIVVNAIGVKPAAHDSADIESFRINSLLPHYLSNFSREIGAKLIHFSTDGVFDGTGGPYSEESFPDASDFYGQSKLVGEPRQSRDLVLRCSMIGRSLHKKNSLVDWVLGSSGQIRGYANAYFNGLPVNELAGILLRHVLRENVDACGLLHLHGARISKLDLIRNVVKEWQVRNLEVVPDGSVVIDRSLSSVRLKRELNFVAPDWPALLTGMREYYQNLQET